MAGTSIKLAIFCSVVASLAQPGLAKPAQPCPVRRTAKTVVATSVAQDQNDEAEEPFQAAASSLLTALVNDFAGPGNGPHGFDAIKGRLAEAPDDASRKKVVIGILKDYWRCCSRARCHATDESAQNKEILNAAFGIRWSRNGGISDITNTQMFSGEMVMLLTTARGETRHCLGVKLFLCNDSCVAKLAKLLSQSGTNRSASHAVSNNNPA